MFWWSHWKFLVVNVKGKISWVSLNFDSWDFPCIYQYTNHDSLFFKCSRRSCKCQKFLLAEVINTVKIFSEKQTELFKMLLMLLILYKQRLTSECQKILSMFSEVLIHHLLNSFSSHFLYIILYVYIWSSRISASLKGGHICIRLRLDKKFSWFSYVKKGTWRLRNNVQENTIYCYLQQKQQKQYTKLSIPGIQEQNSAIKIQWIFHFMIWKITKQNSNSVWLHFPLQKGYGLQWIQTLMQVSWKMQFWSWTSGSGMLIWINQIPEYVWVTAQRAWRALSHKIFSD